MAKPRSTPRLSPRGDEDSPASVASSLEWVTRCCTRLLALNPGLAAAEALDVAQELSAGKAVRALSPEWVAEDLHSAQVQTRSAWGYHPAISVPAAAAPCTSTTARVSLNSQASSSSRVSWPPE